MLVFPLALPPAIPTKKGCNYFYLIYFEFIAKFEKLMSRDEKMIKLLEEKLRIAR